MTKSTRNTIIEYIQGMSEKEAKTALATLLLNYNKIGYGNYTKEKCIEEYEEMYRQIVLSDLFK